MQITVNGEIRSFETSMLLTEFLSELGLENRKAIAVALNGEVISRELYKSTKLDHGDRLEIVRAIGGGF